MAEEFDEGWMMAFDIADLKFVRGDGARNNSIATKYYYDLKISLRHTRRLLIILILKSL